MHASKLVIISGVSGSGKSAALDAFEDLGYFCVDNLPGPLIGGFVSFLKDLPQDWRRGAEWKSSGETPRSGDLAAFALLVDCRDSYSVQQVLQAADSLRAVGTAVELLFFDCRDDVVLRRYQETRRPHPFLVNTTGRTIAEALAHEREVVAEFRTAATRIFDTSSFTPHMLRDEIRKFSGESVKLEVIVQSFGFKFGPPKDADLVVDVRFLPNPHFVADLRPLTGIDPAVASYVLSSPESLEFLDRYVGLLDFLLPKYQKEGKRYLTVGIGCTGGKHRSVVLAEEIGKRVALNDISISVRHRDKERV